MGIAAGGVPRAEDAFRRVFLGAMNWMGGVGLRPEAVRLSREATGGARRGTVTGNRVPGAGGPRRGAARQW